MTELFTTLLPLALYWILAATYLGGWPVDARGGNGFQQVAGLLVSFVLFNVVWRLLHTALLGLGPVLGGIMLASVLTSVLLPVICWLGFKIVGVSVQKVADHAH